MSNDNIIFLFFLSTIVSC